MKNINKNETIHMPDESLLFAYLKNHVSDSEKEFVENWLNESEQNEKEGIQTARIYHAAETARRLRECDPMEAYEKTHKHIKGLQKRIWIKRVIAAAACFIGIVALSGLYLFKTNNIPTPEQQIVTITANAGMCACFNLPDGTTACLNSGSILSYPLPFDSHERRVSLTGEAFFDVSRDEAHPFIVSVNDDRLRIKVLGTKFNLQAYKDDPVIETTLISGLVNIEVRDGENLHEYSLKPTQKAIYNLSENKMNIRKTTPDTGIAKTEKQPDPITIETVDTQSETAWIEGKLIFKNTLLPEALRKLSHYYNVKFETKDTVLNSYRLTGTLVNRRLDQVMDYIKLSSNIDFEIRYSTGDDSNGREQTNIILRKKK